MSMKNYQRTILSILSVLFLFLRFRELGFFALFSLIPFLFVIYNSNLRQTLLFSFICGMGFFVSVTYWMNALPVKFVWLLLTPLLSMIFLIYGISIYFIFILFNTAVFETILFAMKNKKLILKFLVISISILVIFVTYGIVSVNNNLNRVISKKDYIEIKLAAVQPNILLGDKYSGKGLEIIPEPYWNKIYFRENTNLVVFPESMLWGFIEENGRFKNWDE